MKNVKKKLILLFNFIFLFTFFSCSPSVIQETGQFMDTFYTITIVGEDQQTAKKVIEICFENTAKLEKLFDRFASDSEIYKLNQSKILKVSAPTQEIIEEGLKIQKITNGAFDLDLDSLQNIEIKQNMVILSPQGMIDLGGIAKGYVLDKTIKILAENGIENALLDFGGDIYALGKNKGKLWKIGVKNPFNKDKILITLSLENKAIATSGNYERGKHIINPANKLPADECASVTIIAPEATLADGLATGVFVLGVKDGLKLIENLDNVEGIIVDFKGNVFFSSGAQKLL